MRLQQTGTVWNKLKIEIVLETNDNRKVKEKRLKLKNDEMNLLKYFKGKKEHGT